jgi:hypothetical protein
MPVPGNPINKAMRAFEIFTESEGGIIRRAQEVSQGKTITFAKDNSKINLVSTTVIPEAELKYETQPELEQGLKDALAELGNPKVLYFSKVQGKSGAALITLWKDESEQLLAFVKFANAKKAGAFPITWTNADFGRETGYKQADNKIAERAQFNLKPNALFATDVDIPIATLATQIKPRDDLSPEVTLQIKTLLSNVALGKSTPVPGADQYMTTYEVDLGESAAPIALATGNFVTGSYADAEKALLAPLGLTWRSIKSVLFPGGGSNLLYDSYLRLNRENTLKISSKDKKGGAAAAVTGLLKDIEKNPERFAEVTDKPEYQEILNIIKIVADNTAIVGPLQLAEEFGFIDNNDSRNIQQNLGKGIKYDPKLPWASSPGVISAFKRKGAKFQDPAYDMGYHALAGIAELVADHLNKMPGMSDFFKAVLERSTMIQVKSRISKGAGGASFNSFQVIYPPVFDGVIKVVAGNNYMSTRRPIGKISFKIP